MIKRAINHVAGRMALRQMLAIARKRPIEINIETTTVCPSRCVYCPNSKSPKSPAYMDMGLFNKICEDYFRLGGGETWICSTQSEIFSDTMLMERLEVLQKFKKRFNLHTSSTLIGASRLSDQDLTLFLKTFKRLDVSIGGLTKEAYRLMHGGVNAFNSVHEQLFRIEDIVKRENLAIGLNLYFRTNDPENLTDNELLASLKKTYQVKEVKTEFFSWGGLVADEDLPAGATVVRCDNSSVRKNCVLPWALLSISVDGSALACGCVDWQGKHVIGDLKTEGIKEIWKGSRAERFRTSFTRNDIPLLCRDCSSYTDLELSFGRIGLIRYEPRDGCYWDYDAFSLLKKQLKNLFK